MATHPRMRFVSVVIEYLTHDLGHWCRPCALPSGIRMWVAVRSPDRMHLETRVWCDECASRDIEITPDPRR